MTDKPVASDSLTAAEPTLSFFKPSVSSVVVVEAIPSAEEFFSFGLSLFT